MLHVTMTVTGTQASPLERFCGIARACGVVVLTKKSPSHREDVRTLSGHTQIVAVYRSNFRPGNDPDVPVVAIAATEAEKTEGYVTFGRGARATKIPTVERWLDVYADADADAHADGDHRTSTGASAASATGPGTDASPWATYCRQFTDVLGVDIDEAWDIVSRHYPLVSNEVVMTVYVVVCTLYRITQQSKHCLTNTTFRDLYNSEVDIDVIRPKVVQVLADKYLECQALVLDILFDEPADQFPLPWVSVYTMAYVIAAGQTEEGRRKISETVRVIEIPRVVEPVDLWEEMRALCPGNMNLVVMCAPPARRGAILEIRARAQRYWARLTGVAILGSKFAVPCIYCDGVHRSITHHSIATLSVDDSILPLACRACARTRPELGIDADAVADMTAANVRATRGAGKTISAAVREDVVRVQIAMSAETNIDKLRRGFMRYTLVSEGYMAYLREITAFENDVSSGEYLFDSREWFPPGEYKLPPVPS